MGDCHDHGFDHEDYEPSGRRDGPPTRRSGPRVAGCRSCSARIYWATLPGGKRLPVDVEPVEGGNVILALRGGELMGKVLKASTPVEPPDRNRYVSHFSTCPNASSHRSKQ